MRNFNFSPVIARSELGLTREGNEDSGFVSQNLIAVADGMGGHAGGEVASKTAIKTLASLQSLLAAPEVDLDSKADLYLNMVHEMDREIATVSTANLELEGMGTTITALAILNENVSLLHVGDSRCYRIRSAKIEQISTDHTLVQELLKFNNIYCPRDSIDQKKFFKKEIAIKNIKKGDFLFWKGHVAIALNNKKLVHAFGARKKVVMMGIKETIKKIYSKSKLPLLCVKRIKKL